jgi:hypothetical protein
MQCVEVVCRTRRTRPRSPAPLGADTRSVARWRVPARATSGVGGGRDGAGQARPPLQGSHTPRPDDRSSGAAWRPRPRRASTWTRRRATLKDNAPTAAPQAHPRSRRSACRLVLAATLMPGADAAEDGRIRRIAPRSARFLAPRSGINDEGGTAMPRITRMKRISAAWRSGSRHQRLGALGVGSQRSPHLLRSLGRESHAEVARGGAEARSVRSRSSRASSRSSSAAPRLRVNRPAPSHARICEGGTALRCRTPNITSRPGARSPQRQRSIRLIRVIRGIAVPPWSLMPAPPRQDQPSEERSAGSGRPDPAYPLTP